MVSWRTTTLRAWRGLREFLAVQVELYERTALLDRPWEEDSLHGAGDGWARARLEGTRQAERGAAPPAEAPRSAATASAPIAIVADRDRS